jgi:SAM-dependent methyltransferase
MQLFRRKLSPGPSTRILDVGGDDSFWIHSDIPSASITILNVQPRSEPGDHPFVIGDACDLPFADKSFDIVFSNSAIEHVGTWQRQVDFAREVRRVGKSFWVQTPAREFFVEPHLMAPFIHWLPLRAQRRLIRNATLWGWITRPSKARVETFLQEVRLLSKEEVARLFPGSELLRERTAGLTKSYIAMKQ